MHLPNSLAPPPRELDDEAFALRLGELKHEVIELVNDRWTDLFVAILLRRFGKPVVASRADLIEFTDRFALQYRLPHGRSPIEVLADETKDLHDEERSALKRWSEVREGIFEIRRRDGLRLDAHDLSESCDVVIRSNMRRPPKELGPGVIVRSRVVPVRTFLVFSGYQEIIDPRRLRLVVEDVQRGGRCAPLEPLWLPTPTEPAPIPSAPCPCDSGRKYKNCCLRFTSQPIPMAR